jgi:pimeloyl-ACP methyl ester carboxylesterase
MDHRCPNTLTRRIVLLAASAVVLGACAGGDGGDAGPQTTGGAEIEGAAATEQIDEDEQAEEAEEAGWTDTEAGEVVTGGIEELVDVGGHSLYLNCAGSGSPTVVYLHGAIFDDGIVPHRNGLVFQRHLSQEYQVCVYDRRNLGNSDTVDAVQTPEAILADLARLLAAAAIDPPYVLLGASFGGTIAYHYAVTHPDEVVGLVLLDSMIPDQLPLEDMYPPEERMDAFVDDDACCTSERIAHFDVLEAAAAYIGQEPDIPVVYLASSREPTDPDRPDVSEAFIPLLEGFVARFPRGELVWVDAPHFMEPAIPAKIADALHDVIASADG